MGNSKVHTSTTFGKIAKKNVKYFTFVLAALPKVVAVKYSTLCFFFQRVGDLQQLTSLNLKSNALSEIPERYVMHVLIHHMFSKA